MIMMKEGVDLEKMGFKPTGHENNGLPIYAKALHVSGYNGEYGFYAVVNGVGSDNPRELVFEAECGDNVGFSFSADELYKLFKDAEEANV